MKIYILGGYVSCYEDHDDWIVGAYTSKRKAKRLEKECNAESRRLYKEMCKARNTSDAYFSAEEVQSKLDPRMCFKSEAARYYTLEIELDEAIE